MTLGARASQPAMRAVGARGMPRRPARTQPCHHRVHTWVSVLMRNPLPCQAKTSTAPVSEARRKCHRV